MSTDAVRAFWRFVVRRHDMFVRRFGLKQPPPWTDDPYLARGHFTNVYRELDRGTRYLITKILPGAAVHPADVFFSVVLYRMFNLIDTYEALLGMFSRPEYPGLFPIKMWTPSRVAKFLVRRQREGHRVYTGAYMVNSIGARPGLGGKVELSVKRLNWLYENLGDVRDRVLQAPSMEQAHAQLTRIPGVAAFNAYEIVIDMCYDKSILAFSEDDWVNPGPGAIKGLQEIYGERLSRREARLAIHDLRYTQDVVRRVIGAWLQGPRLTLRNVEHSLCEYSKYCRMQRGEWHKRTYKPGPYSNDVSLWDTVPNPYYGRE